MLRASYQLRLSVPPPNTCFNFSSKEEKLDIICRTLSNLFLCYFNKYFEAELLKDNNKWLCSICDDFQESIRDSKIVNCGNILIFQLKRYSRSGSSINKDNRVVKSHSDILNAQFWQIMML